MSDNLTIRRYRRDDAERVWTVHELALRASPLEYVENAPDDDLENVTEEYLDSGGEFLVGILSGEIVGIGGYQPLENGEAELRRMRVHPDYQRNGFGEAILEELESRAETRGIDRFVLYTNEQLNAAIEMYQKHGYDITSRESHPETGDEFLHLEKRL